MTPLELSVLRELVDKSKAELAVCLAEDTRGNVQAMRMVDNFVLLVDYLEEHK